MVAVWTILVLLSIAVALFNVHTKSREGLKIALYGIAINVLFLILNITDVL